MFGGKEKGEIAYKAKLTFKSFYLWLLSFFFWFVSIVNYKWFTCTYSTGFFFSSLLSAFISFSFLCFDTKETTKLVV